MHVICKSRAKINSRKKSVLLNVYLICKPFLKLKEYFILLETKNELYLMIESGLIGVKILQRWWLKNKESWFFHSYIFQIFAEKFKKKANAWIPVNLGLLNIYIFNYCEKCLRASHSYIRNLKNWITYLD